MILKYIGRYWKSLLLALLPTGMIVGFMPLPQIVYYIGLIFFFLLFLRYADKLNMKYLFFVIAISVGCMIFPAPEFFQQWLRFPLLVLVLGVTTPLFTSIKAYNIRSRALRYLLYILCFIAVGSFIGYFFGINYMKFFYATNPSETNRWDLTGWFGGLTPHSMLLAPCSAIAIVYFVYKLQSLKPKRNLKIFLISCIAASFISLVLTASRGALGAAVVGVGTVVYLSYKGNVKKLIWRAIGVAALLVALYPLYSAYTTGMEIKQTSNLEQGGTFSSRSVKWENRLEEFSSSPVFGIGVGIVEEKFVEDYSRSGVIEPGSSWLAILSMTGLFGFLMFFYILVPVFKDLVRKSKRYGGDFTLLSGLIAVFLVHMIIEGYIFSGGSCLCFLFWLIFGVGCAITEVSPKDNHRL